jgi:hypothetical protein
VTLANVQAEQTETRTKGETKKAADESGDSHRFKHAFGFHFVAESDRVAVFLPDEVGVSATDVID